MRRVNRGLGAVIGVLMSASFLPVVAPIGAAVAVAPVGQGFNLNASDLRFILQQIKIAEAHAASATAANPCGTLLGAGPNQIPNAAAQAAQLPWGLRTVDGTCNNLLPGKAKLGAAGNIFPRRMTAQFRNAETSPTAFGGVPTSYTQKSGLVFDSQPRVASNSFGCNEETLMPGIALPRPVLTRAMTSGSM